MPHTKQLGYYHRCVLGAHRPLNTAAAEIVSTTPWAPGGMENATVPEALMLQHGLQGFQGRRIHVPRADHLKPNRDVLAKRYALFRRAS